MKRLIVASGIIFAMGFTEVISQESAISLEEAKKEIENYIKGAKEASVVEVCEGDKYYVGEVYLKGYEGFDVVRKIYVNKKTGDLYPTMAETFDYCYMVKNR